MRMMLMAAAVAAGLLAAAVAQAQAQAGVAATCKDGTSYSGTTRRGACAGHGGVQAWTAGGPASKQATAPKPSATSTAAAANPAPAGRPAAGGQVWVNTSSKVYHCPGSTWYGKTKQGEYMPERDALAKGFHADHGKACS